MQSLYGGVALFLKKNYIRQSFFLPSHIYWYGHRKTQQSLLSEGFLLREHSLAARGSESINQYLYTVEPVAYATSQFTGHIHPRETKFVPDSKFFHSQFIGHFYWRDTSSVFLDWPDERRSYVCFAVLPFSSNRGEKLRISIVYLSERLRNR